jgi:hypothetical protein
MSKLESNVKNADISKLSANIPGMPSLPANIPGFLTNPFLSNSTECMTPTIILTEKDIIKEIIYQLTPNSNSDVKKSIDENILKFNNDYIPTIESINQKTDKFISVYMKLLYIYYDINYVTQYVDKSDKNSDIFKEVNISIVGILAEIRNKLIERRKKDPFGGLEFDDCDASYKETLLKNDNKEKILKCISTKIISFYSVYLINSLVCAESYYQSKIIESLHEFFKEHKPEDELFNKNMEFPENETENEAENEAFKNVLANFNFSKGGSPEKKKKKKIHTIKQKVKKRKFTIRNGKPKQKKEKKRKTIKRRKITRRKRKDHR